MQPLPIDELLPEITEALRHESRLVVIAPAGTGKSTRVPVAVQAILTRSANTVLVSEPRRIAARLLAQRVAVERSERVGQSVGYRVRFERVDTAATVISYATSGVLLRQIAADSRLAGVGCLIVDEFHERHLDTDLLLALALRAQEQTRPDLKIVIMSATIDAQRVDAALGGCKTLQSTSRTHPITIEYADPHDERPVEKKIASALRGVLGTGARGNVLVFLPGAREIRVCHEKLSAELSSHGRELMTLHGDMPLSEQAVVLQASERQRIILATNVAESSVTVPGVDCVVDSGLARQAACSPWSGLRSLDIRPISRASATQRAGRAGRLGPGRVVRLYARGDFETRPEHDVPEILRMDLSEAILVTLGAGVKRLEELKFVDCPIASQVAAAEQLLRRLGAIGGEGSLSNIGRQMLQLPVHPRLARMIIESHMRGIGDLGCLAAAILSERDLRFDFRAPTRAKDTKSDLETGDSDVQELIETFEVAQTLRFDLSRCARERIDGRMARRVADSSRQLSRTAAKLNVTLARPEQPELELRRALLRAYPDRVAFRRQPKRAELTLASGISASLSEASVVRDARYLVAIEADERQSKGQRGGTWVRVACRIDPNWLWDLDDPALQTEDRYYWAEPSGRVENQSVIRYGSIILDESHATATPNPEVTRVLCAVALERGILRGEAITSLRERLALLSRFGLNEQEHGLSDGEIEQVLCELCRDRVDLDGVSDATVAEHLINSRVPATARALREWTPIVYRLPSGRCVKVHYEPGREPWIESRLQDFFGLVETPCIAEHQQPLTLHLLAPNHRAVQVTRDLSGFWERHYPAIRRELMRRYPKHQWPEDGRTAKPPEVRSGTSR